MSALPSHSDPFATVLINLTVVVLAATLGRKLATWIKQPAVLGELLSGIVVGNLGIYFGISTLLAIMHKDVVHSVSNFALQTNISIQLPS